MWASGKEKKDRRRRCGNMGTVDDIIIFKRKREELEWKGKGK